MVHLRGDVAGVLSERISFIFNLYLMELGVLPEGRLMGGWTVRDIWKISLTRISNESA